MSDVHHVLLVPGFFGFDSLGDFAYFVHVVDALEGWSQAQGIPLRVKVVPTLPTASLRRRAAHVLEAMAEAAAEDEGPIHLIGHSSGGLDVRLVTTPNVSLPSEHAPEPLAARVRSVVTLATPHHGTPVAAWFSSLLGAQLLKVFSLASSYVLRTGRLPLDLVARLVPFFMGAFSGIANRNNALEAIYDRLLSDFAPQQRAPLETFISQIGSDQDLLHQITPAAMDTFNASTYDRAGVRYGSVVSETRGTAFRSFVSAGLSPYAHASHALYLAISRVAAAMPAERVPTLNHHQAQALRRDFGNLPGRRMNDGIVPTISQVWGEVIRGVVADHLDVIGHFHHPTHVPPHFDWLTSGSGFDRRGFLRLWNDIAAFMCADSVPPARGPSFH